MWRKEEEQKTSANQQAKTKTKTMKNVKQTNQICIHTTTKEVKEMKVKNTRARTHTAQHIA